RQPELARLLRVGRSRRLELRGEAREVPRARGRVLPGAPVRGVLRDAPGTPRRGGARVVHLAGVRRRTRTNRALDVPGARARPLRGALPRAACSLGTRRRVDVGSPRHCGARPTRRLRMATTEIAARK